MAFIKKMVMQGFKSFARRTEIPFENSMNVIVGPNGSGKSNVADALCFVLGRMSIKSIRAAKAANLLFSGNKDYKGSNEASVEMVFDNRDMAFSINTPEVSIKRIVRKNGLSIYKINEETKTRQELIELLAQAGIDPNGFNIVLQGDITSLVKIGAEERRKIIEDVAGISIYETRKQKSLAELEKVEEKLKEVGAVLREKNAYLKNLEKDRQDALNYQKLDQTIKKCKATILSKSIKDKEKEIWGIDKLVENQKKEIQDIKKKVEEKNKQVIELEEKISSINKNIQSSTGEEQEKLHEEIADLKASIAGLTAKRENFELRLEQNRNKEVNMKTKIKELEEEIGKIKINSPEIKKQQDQIKETREKFDLLEKGRREYYVIKSELATLENKREEKTRKIIEYKKELEFIDRSINQIFGEIKHEKSLDKATSLKEKIHLEVRNLKDKKIITEKEILEIEKTNAVLNGIIDRERKLKQDIINLDICPTCKSTVTEEHRKQVIDTANNRMQKAEQDIQANTNRKIELAESSSNNSEKVSQLEQKAREIELDLYKIRNAEDKKENIKRTMESKRENEMQLEDIMKKIESLQDKFQTMQNIEEKYDETRLKLQELSVLDVDTDTTVLMKNRELERLRMEIKTIARDSEESSTELKKIMEKLIDDEKISMKKEDEEQVLYEKFKKLFANRNELQDTQKALETNMIGLQHEIRSHEDKIGHFNIQKAQQQAQMESFKFDFKDLEGIEILSISIEQARQKVQECQLRLNDLGSINLKALEVYDQVKQACEQIEEKINMINAEKEKVKKIIEEIDKKKRKTFVRTLDSVNTLFTRNFTQLSKKGEVFLDLENKEDPFAGGLNIIVKVGKGKYFDITSLSGGEKTLVALSLIFAIQEHKPYCFYVFDEIDAALDKHNSELLAGLIKRYMLSGQYIVITHNDALISEATNLYGVSMQEGLSKVISLKV
ncbi:chromosome segregation protein SMC [Candidatus Pacearchaeota archaeon]|nr:chromosome segregation protein SMC [Candidatus Pacearchaeota archaeon]